MGSAYFEATGKRLFGLLEDAHLWLLPRATNGCGASLIPAWRTNFLFLRADTKDLELIVVQCWPGHQELLIVDAFVAAKRGARLLM